MWTLLVAGFMALLGWLLEGAARRGTPIPWPLRLAPFGFLLAAILGGWAGFEQETTRYVRDPRRSFADLGRGPEPGLLRVLLAGRVGGDAGGPPVYEGRAGGRPFEVHLHLDGGDLLVRTPRVYGARTHVDQVVVPAGAEVLAEGVLERYTDGTWYLTDAELYAWDLASYRKSILMSGWGRWPYAAGGVLAALVFLVLAGKAARSAKPTEAPGEEGTRQPPQAP